VPDIEAHQALAGHQGHSGASWARVDDVQPSAAALTWSLVNAEPFTPDCLGAPVVPTDCPSLFLTQANEDTQGAIRLIAGATPPSGIYKISGILSQTSSLVDSTFMADDPNPGWHNGLCVQADGKQVSGIITLSRSLSGTDDASMQLECHIMCMSHQTPPEWRDLSQYASGRKHGCELTVAVGWPAKGCYLHTSPAIKMANGAAHRFCKLSSFDLPSAARRSFGLDPGISGIRALQEVAVDQGSAVSARQNGGGGSMSEAPVCKLPTPPVVSPYFLVLRDGQGNPLMNNYK